jgi:hypothetical protein
MSKNYFPHTSKNYLFSDFIFDKMKEDFNTYYVSELQR